jgi:hypothetical protein
LYGKKLMTQVYCHPPIPIFRRHIGIRMAIVARRIVHEHLDRAVGGLDLRHGSSQRRDIGQVTSEENRSVRASGRKVRNQSR